MRYNKKLIFDYVFGNDINNYDIEELENNYIFMMEVIKFTKDKNMYDLCSDNVKTNYEFVRFLVENFKNDKSFITKVADKYLKTVNDDDITYKELVILMSNITDKNLEIVMNDMNYTNNENYPLNIYSIKALAFYQTEKAIITNVLDKSTNKKNLGLGFAVINNEYSSSEIIKNFFAKIFAYEIFYKTSKCTLEQLIHKNFKSNDFLEKKGINNFIVDYILNFDSYLSVYISCHLDLVKTIQKDIINIEINWDNYMDRLNNNRVDIIYSEIQKFSENNTDITFNCYEVLNDIIKNTYLEEIFKRYDEDNGLLIINPEIPKNTKFKNIEFKEIIYRRQLSELLNKLFKVDYINPEMDDDYIIENQNNQKSKNFCVKFKNRVDFPKK